MRHLLLTALVLLFAAPARTQNPPLSLPMYPPVHCNKQADNCVYPGGGVVGAGKTGILVARQASGGVITDSLGNIWTLDQCMLGGDNYDCIFHTIFAANPNNYSDKLTLTGNNFYDVYLFVYKDHWAFDSGQWGTYSLHNYPFSDCVNGGDCPYSWTLPIDADAGSLIISWANNNTTYGAMLARPGPGFNLEANDGNFAVEDMIAPVDGIYIGSLIWSNLNGTPSGGTHWLMGIAAYKRIP